jgi:hypothetical protein
MGDPTISGSFALEEFVGNGALQDQLDSLIADGWADVPTLKVMSQEDMDLVGLTQQQRVCTHAVSVHHQDSGGSMF